MSDPKWTLGTLAAEMGRAIRHEVPPGAIQGDATELIALTCANIALRGVVRAAPREPSPHKHLDSEPNV